MVEKYTIEQKRLVDRLLLENQKPFWQIAQLVDCDVNLISRRCRLLKSAGKLPEDRKKIRTARTKKWDRESRPVIEPVYTSGRKLGTMSMVMMLLDEKERDWLMRQTPTGEAVALVVAGIVKDAYDDQKKDN
jgi:hypothetical protein